MKITVDLDESYIENEVVIKCSKINEEIIELQKVISTYKSKNVKIKLYKVNVVYYEFLENIIFFETEGECGKSSHKR